MHTGKSRATAAFRWCSSQTDTRSTSNTGATTSGDPPSNSQGSPTARPTKCATPSPTSRYVPAYPSPTSPSKWGTPASAPPTTTTATGATTWATGPPHSDRNGPTEQAKARHDSGSIHEANQRLEGAAPHLPPGHSDRSRRAFPENRFLQPKYLVSARAVRLLRLPILGTQRAGQHRHKARGSPRNDASHLHRGFGAGPAAPHLPPEPTHRSQEHPCNSAGLSVTAADGAASGETVDVEMGGAVSHLSSLARETLAGFSKRRSSNNVEGSPSIPRLPSHNWPSASTNSTTQVSARPRSCETRSSSPSGCGATGIRII